jgi:hypothetical protein
MKLLALFIFLSTALSASGQQATDIKYVIDRTKSKLYWQDPGKHHKGYILFRDGELFALTKGMPTRGAFTLDMLSMRSTDGKNASERKKTDDKLRSPEYFEVAKYPTANVVIRQIVPEKATNTYKVTGELKIKGQSAPLVFLATLKQNGKAMTAHATLSISRNRYNINKAKQRLDVLTSIYDSLSEDLIPVELDLHFVRK